MGGAFQQARSQAGALGAVAPSAGPILNSEHSVTILQAKLIWGYEDSYRMVHKFCNKLKCDYLPMSRRQIDKICRDFVEHIGLWHNTVSFKIVAMHRDCGR